MESENDPNHSNYYEIINGNDLTQNDSVINNTNGSGLFRLSCVILKYTSRKKSKRVR